MSDNADFDVIGDAEQCDYCGQWTGIDFKPTITAQQAEIKRLRADNAWAEQKMSDMAIDAKEVKARLDALTDAADKYSDNGHHEVCPVNGNYHAKCTCGLAELETLLEAEK